MNHFWISLLLIALSKESFLFNNNGSKLEQTLEKANVDLDTLLKDIRRQERLKNPPSVLSVDKDNFIGDEDMEENARRQLTIEESLRN